MGPFFVPMIHTLLALFIYSLTATIVPWKSLPAEAVDFIVDMNSARAERSFSLGNRYPDEWVNTVFKDNILLTLSYLDGDVHSTKDINWNDVTKPQTYSFTLNPEEVFVFNEIAHFNYNDGFKSSGYLYGDGVCHLASLIYWVAKDAGLDAVAPTNHDFRTIPEIPKEYGVSIYFHPDRPAANARQNLYVTNTLNVPIQFLFTYDGTNLTVKVVDAS